MQPVGEAMVLPRFGVMVYGGWVDGLWVEFGGLGIQMTSFAPNAPLWSIPKWD